MTWNFTEADFFDLGEPGGLPIAVALREREGKLELALKVPEEATGIRVGVANGKEAYVLDLGTRNAEFPVGDWSRIRLAVSVERRRRRSFRLRKKGCSTPMGRGGISRIRFHRFSQQGIIRNAIGENSTRLDLDNLDPLLIESGRNPKS